MKVSLSFQSGDIEPGLPSEKELLFFIHHILKHELFLDLPDNSSLSVVFVEDQEMKNLNQTYRNAEKSTDILSFSLHTKTPKGYLWGELIISLRHAYLNAQEKSHSIKEELSFLIIHGLLHLHGFDHENPEEEMKMQKYERILSNIYSLRG